jgi:hypothetical protein
MAKALGTKRPTRINLERQKASPLVSNHRQWFLGKQKMTQQTLASPTSSGSNSNTNKNEVQFYQDQVQFHCTTHISIHTDPINFKFISQIRDTNLSHKFTNPFYITPYEFLNTRIIHKSQTKNNAELLPRQICT